MLYSLPPLAGEAIRLSHFPTKHQAFIFRAYELVPIGKIAQILNTSPKNVRRAAADMGLPDTEPGNIWRKKGYITIIRRMWHILPYEQLLALLDLDEQALAALMIEEDFLGIKLSEKPICSPVTWRELTAEERQQTEKIKKMMDSLDFSGKKPFAFTYSVPHITFAGEERIKTRMIYAFSGLYQHAFDMDSREFLPDEQLEAYQALGINGIWTQGILSQLADFPFDPTVSAGYEKRLNRMRALTERLDRYGIKLYLYLNEPRSMPLDFFETHPDIRGQVRKNTACLCTSAEPVRAYLRDALESVCRAVPLIGGFFTITRSENRTNCYSHTVDDCNCPRCGKRDIGEVIAEVIGCFRDGIRRVSDEIKLFAWSWRWDEYSEEIIRRLPKDVILLSQSELDIPFAIGGVEGRVIDYSMSIPGPGKHALREWALARECGLETGAKVQINTTWEASTVPALPLSPSIEAHMRALTDEGVRHLLLSWTLGGYPCRNIAAAAKYFYAQTTIRETNSSASEAEKIFVEAFREFPFHITVLYLGPQNAGPANLLYEEPTGYRATMTCFPYDDLEHWRAIYPVDVFERQFALLCQRWEIGLGMLDEADHSETAVMARAAYCLFRSSLNQIRFIRARDEGRTADASNAARDELQTAQTMLALMNENAAIGYEAANHYYFTKGQLAEKIINCHSIIEHLREKQKDN